MKAKQFLSINQIRGKEYHIVYPPDIDAYVKWKHGQWVLDIFQGPFHLNTFSYEELDWGEIVNTVIEQPKRPKE